MRCEKARFLLMVEGLCACALLWGCSPDSSNPPKSAAIPVPEEAPVAAGPASRAVVGAPADPVPVSPSAIPAAAQEAGVQTAVNNSVYWDRNGHWYEAVAVGPQGITWKEAQAAAEQRGGYLATITSAAENEFVFSLIKDNDAVWEKDRGVNWDGPWIGGFQTDKRAEPAGHWAWVSGEPWEYTAWNPGEPNNYYDGMEDYLTYHGAGGRPTPV